MNSLINNEKGAWVIFLVPFFSGIMFIQHFTADVILFSVSSFIVFLGYKPLSIILRERLITKRITGRYPLKNVLIFCAGILGVLFSVIRTHNYIVLPFGAAIMLFYGASLLLLKNKSYRFLSDLSGITGLTGISALLYLCTEHAMVYPAVILWFANTLFFCGMGLYVYYRIETLSGKQVSGVFKSVVSVYIALLLCSGFLTGFTERINFWLLIGLFCPIIHTIIMFSLKKAEKSFRILGWVLTAYSLVFLVCVSRAGL